jgi:hypothetical protein
LAARSWVGQQRQDTNSCVILPRIAQQKKPHVGDLPRPGPESKHSRRRVWQPTHALIIFAPSGGVEKDTPMNRSLPQLFGFVVLAVIVLSTGFLALGGPTPLPGAF